MLKNLQINEYLKTIYTQWNYIRIKKFRKGLKCYIKDGKNLK